MGSLLGQCLQETNCLLPGNSSSPDGLEKPGFFFTNHRLKVVFSSRNLLEDLLAGSVALSCAPCVCWSHFSCGANHSEFYLFYYFPHET